MKISEIMSPNVEVAESYMMLDEAAEVMREADVGALPIVEDGCLLGILTDRDIVVRAISIGDDPGSTGVRLAMTEDVVTVFGDQSVQDAMELMANHQVRRLPVLDRAGKLIGMVSLADVSIQAQPPDAIADLLRAISEQGPHSHAGVR